VAQPAARAVCCASAGAGAGGPEPRLGEEAGRALREQQKVREHRVRSLVVVARHQRLQRLLDAVQHLPRRSGSRARGRQPPLDGRPGACYLSRYAKA